MGFQLQKVMLIEFEDPDLEGLEVRARRATVAGILGIMGIVDALDRPASQRSIADLHNVDRLFRALAGCPAGCVDEHLELPPGQDHYLNRLVSWNLEEVDSRNDNFVPVPANYEGLIAQDFDFSLNLAMAWLNSIVGTPGPLEPTSSAGGQPAEESIPMETLSLAPPL